MYKAFENLGGLKSLGFRSILNTQCLLSAFHGFGLATKLQQLTLSEEGLLENLIAFNIGVELGQLSALIIMVTLMNVWRYSDKFPAQSLIANSVLMGMGFLFIFYQLTGYVVEV